VPIKPKTLFSLHVSHAAVHLVNKNVFRCAFYEIPAADPDDLRCEALTLSNSDIRVHHGTLSVDFAPGLVKMGSFKTSHPGKVQLDNNSELLPFTNGTVCVKQMYERKGNSGNGAISRLTLKGHLELDAQFVARKVKTRGEPPYPIPTLRFTRVMIAHVHDLPAPKAFLNNRVPHHISDSVPLPPQYERR